MKEFDLEGLSREMPYKMPEPCLPVPPVLQPLLCCSCIRLEADWISQTMTVFHSAQALMNCSRTCLPMSWAFIL